MEAGRRVAEHALVIGACDDLAGDVAALLGEERGELRRVVRSARFARGEAEEACFRTYYNAVLHTTLTLRLSLRY